MTSNVRILVLNEWPHPDLDFSPLRAPLETPKKHPGTIMVASEVTDTP